MTCETVRPLLGAFVDQELNLAEEWAVREHVSTCEACRLELEGLRALREVAARAPRFTVSENLMTRIEKSLPAEKPPKAKPIWIGFFALGAACSAVAFILFGLFSRFDNRIEAELLASHIRSLMPGHLMDVVSSDRHTVKPWFVGKISLAPSPWDLKSDGFPLLGGRLDYISGKPTAVLVYGHREHKVNLYVLSADQATGVQTEDRQGFHLLAWSAADLRYVAISDVDEAELIHFVQAYRAAGGQKSTEQKP